MDIRPDYITANKYFDSIADWAKKEVSTSSERFALIMGVLDKYKPKTMVEIGVSAGILSGALLYKALQYTDEPLLYGIDAGEFCYFDKSFSIGTGLSEFNPKLASFFSLHTNKRAIDADNIVRHKIDFAYIDANHCHPWASVDLLCLLPHLSEGAIIGFHDTNYKIITTHAHAGVHTFRSLEAEKFEDTNLDYLGSGFCVYSSESKFLDSLLDSFLLPWETEVDDAVVAKVLEIASSLGAETETFGRRLEYIRKFSPFLKELEEGRKKEFMHRVHGSSSWKLTAPLRWLGKFLCLNW